MNAPITLMLPPNASQVAPSAAILRGRLFERLTKTIHLNELGLPKYLYRNDLIPPDFDELPKENQNQWLSAAVIEVTYREGYPTFLDGQPIWEQMLNEGDEDFGLFQLYRDLISIAGYRQLVALKVHVEKRNPEGANKVELISLQETAAEYFWYARVKAYDLFCLSAHRKRREQRMMDVENFHYEQADGMLRSLQLKLSEVFSDDKIAAMEITDFVKVWKSLSEVQRTSLGMAASGGGGGKAEEGAPPQHASLEVTMQSIARSTKANQQDESGQGGTGKILDLVNNPEALEAAQSMILKIRMGGRTTQEVSERTLASDEAQDLAMIHGDTNE